MKTHLAMLMVTRFLVFVAGLGVVGWQVGAQERPRAGMTIEECVVRALERNLTAQSRKIEHDIAGVNVSREWGTFEPMLVGSVRGEENNRENTVEQFRNQLTGFFEEENVRYDLGVEGQFLSGARYRFGYSINDLSNNLTNNVVTVPFQSQYQSFLGPR